MSSSDSSDEEVRARIGDVPLSWYENLPFLGYDVDGKSVPKIVDSDELEKHIKKTEDPEWWRTMIDHLNSKKVKITDEMLEVIRRIRQRRPITQELDPYSDFDLTAEKQQFGIDSDKPLKKKNFTPSKWERMKVRKIAEALEKKWLQPQKKEKGVEVWDIWAEENTDEKPGPPKSNLPSHTESYNPPEEYLFSPEEENEWHEKLPMNRELEYLPQKHSCLRRVPSYSQTVKECFERCLDLFLAPRVHRPKINVDPDSLIPDIPDPESFRPFPEQLQMSFEGHEHTVTSANFSSSGEWLASADSGGFVKIWETATGRCFKTINAKKRVYCVNWNPVNSLLAICSGKRLIIKSFDFVGKVEIEPQDTDNEYAEWKFKNEEIKIKLRKGVRQMVWHNKGDYFATLCKRENVSRKVLVHSLSRFKSQKIFSKQSKGDIRTIAFHPKRPLFFVGTEKNIMTYNLKQELLVKRLVGLEQPVQLQVHGSGDHILAACEDCKLQWYDYDLSTTPYKTFVYHKAELTSVDTHSRYPLLATSSRDSSIHIFHAQVYQDYLHQPLVVPVKIIKTKEVPVKCLFHPKQPWLAVVLKDKIQLFI